MVASGTRNALAISRVVEAADRPQGERDGRRRRERRVAAHEHQDQRVVVPRSGVGRASDHDAASSSRRRRASSRRYWSAMRREATRTSHPSGLSGSPRPATWWWRRGAPPARRPRRRRSRRSGGRRHRGPAAPARAAGPRCRGGCHTSGSGALSTSRTSMGWRIGTPFGPGRRRGLGRDLDGPLGRLDVHQPVAGQQLLGLGERAVGDHRSADPVRHHELGLLGPGQPLGVDQLAALDELLVQRLLELDVGLDVLGSPLRHRRRSPTRPLRSSAAA